MTDSKFVQQRLGTDDTKKFMDFVDTLEKISFSQIEGHYTLKNGPVREDGKMNLIKYNFPGKSFEIEMAKNKNGEGDAKNVIDYLKYRFGKDCTIKTEGNKFIISNPIENISQKSSRKPLESLVDKIEKKEPMRNLIKSINTTIKRGENPLDISKFIGERARDVVQGLSDRHEADKETSTYFLNDDDEEIVRKLILVGQREGLINPNYQLPKVQ